VVDAVAVLANEGGLVGAVLLAASPLPIRRPLPSVGAVLVNTGTWLKRLHRRDGVIGVLPPVFYPSYQLRAVRIAAESEGVVVEHQAIEKPSPGAEELTLTERLLTLGREPDPALPDRTVLEDAEATTESTEAVH
jgi:hypothetical protein